MVVTHGITRDRQLSHLKLSDHVYILLLFLQQAIKVFRQKRRYRPTNRVCVEFANI